MLTKKAEDFLLKLRIELLFRGKNEKEVNEIEEELRDHIITAEAQNESTDDLLNTPVKTYANTFSKELNLTQGIYKYIFYFISFMTIMVIIPRMLDNSFQLTLALIFYIIFIFIGSFVFILFFFKKLIMTWGDSKKTYTAIGFSSAAIFGIYLLSEYLLRHYPIFTFWAPNQTTNFVTGSILLIMTIAICFLLKQKYFAGLILILCIPNLLGLIFTGSDYTNPTYVIISSIVLTILSLIFISYIVVQYYREKKNQQP
ncbi:hypothetical protein [Staphylococcus edaphicus]|uniref:DUF1129 domain-containing protein n=1 Tax=Staphylococcus edaphicus TaxID=1955013 RepID=A0ABY4QF22_9STAP|nr:hypothetical protein [Staphylococcus edaphicus]UQW82022.1 hypothetical protein MNY58_02630 [Staphylococcus edaphicus]